MMRAKSMVLITIALGCGLVASIGISQVIKTDGGKSVETAEIFVAMTDLDINQKLNAENVKLEAWPKDRIPEGALANFKDLEQKFVTMRLYKGEPILVGKIAHERFTSSNTIPKGYRVCSAKVTMESAVSNLIQPGDRVDLIAFLRRNNDIPQTTMRTILRDVRLFAINSETEISTDEAGKKIAAKTVSVLVSEDQVPSLMLALELGKLRLSLRNPEEQDDQVGPDEVTVDQLLGKKAESADENIAQETGTAASTFMSFISEQTRKAPIVVNTGFRMKVLTPNGVDEYQWDDEHELPQKVPFAGGTLFGPNTGEDGDQPLPEGDQPLPEGDQPTQENEAVDAPQAPVDPAS